MALTKDQEELIKENISLAYFVARRWKKKNVSMEELLLEDLISDCLLGLVQASIGFDGNKGYKFSTYAVRIMDCIVIKSFRKLNKKKNEILISSLKKDGIDSEFDIWDNLYFHNSSKIDEIEKWFNENAIFEMVNNFKGKVKELLLLSFQGISQQEISKIIGMSQGYVSEHKIKAYKKIYKKLY